MSQDRPRFRFTLRDLIALTTIAAMGAALLSFALTTMDGGHRSSLRAQCINNQRQVGLGLLIYATAMESFPGYDNDLAGARVPWSVRILPNVGRRDIYDWYVQTAGPRATDSVDIYTCPSDKNKQKPGRALSYVLNAGCATDDEDKAAIGVGLNCTGSMECVSMSYIALHDGTATTLLLSENFQATTWDMPGKMDTVFLWHATTTPKPEHLINGGKKDAPLSRDTARPSSYHNGGVVMTFCDGHTRFINEQIDYRAYVQLMTPNGKDSDMPAEWKNYIVQEAELR